MKGGNEALLTALETLQRAGLLSQMNITVWFSGDEETPGLGKDGTTTTTRREFIAIAKKADVALCFEKARKGNNYMKPAKRGSSTSGRSRPPPRSGHSSTIFKPDIGTGAIYPLSQIVARFQTELRTDPQITVNVGLMAGGGRLEDGKAGTDSTTAFGKDNVVASRARAFGDIRFLDEATLQKTRSTMQTIADQENRQSPHRARRRHC